jgi:Patatin-like phospholipase
MKTPHTRLFDFADVWESEIRSLIPDSSSGDGAVDPQTPELKHARNEALVDGHDAPIAALCLSGGGIRSASFALGALQGLARFGLLKQFHYLSTVSGGGYIGGWLTAWRSAARDDKAVFEALNQLQSSGDEAKEIKGIRADSNYLTPKLGLLSADTWTVVALYIRNLFLNWCVFLPFFLGCLMFPRVCQSILTLPFLSPQFFSATLTAGLLLLAALMLGIGLTANVYGRYRGSAGGFSRAAFLVRVLAPIVLAAMILTLATQTPAPFSLNGHSVWWGAPVGALLYAVPWGFAALLLGARRAELSGLDCLAWTLAGAVVGMLIAVALDLGNLSAISPSVLTIVGLSGFVFALLVGELVYIGLSSFLNHAEENREWLARSSGWLSATAGTWLVVSGLALYGPDIFHYFSKSAATMIAGAGAGGLSGAMTLILGWSKSTAATQARAAGSHLSAMQIASLAAVVFAVFIGVALSVAGEQLEAWLTVLPVSSPTFRLVFVWDVIAAVGLIALSAVVSYAVNINRFSLHALYRNRIIRAFLGSARAGATPARAPDPFTGFDFTDNRLMAAVLPSGSPVRLLHVINMALNVVSSENPAWQERKAESFTVTPIACGNSQVGYRPTADYGGRHGGITLGTAMAISGAAVSPNQGYNSSPLIGLLLMLFNIRLGWWLGNPKREGYRREGPLFSLTPALKELAGATTDSGQWIYLSDGGHFENLAIYEMVRRRCRFIVVSDAGCDPKCSFEDLGNAVRKCFIDFGVSINFKELGIAARQSPPRASARLAIGSIHYPGSDRPGVLVYVKPTYCATTEPPHVRSYAAVHDLFPHEPTADQWFSESQLEAYRALGAHVFERICSGGAEVAPGKAPTPMNLHSLLESAKACLAADVAALR